MSFISKNNVDNVVVMLENNPVVGLIADPGSGKSTTIVNEIYKKGASIYVVEQTITAVEGLFHRMKTKIPTNKIGYAANAEIHYNNDFLRYVNDTETLIRNVSNLKNTLYFNIRGIDDFFHYLSV